MEWTNSTGNHVNAFGSRELAKLERGRPYVRLTEVLVGRGTELAGETPINPSLVTDATTGAVTRITRVHSDWGYRVT
jgi:hypothetical protein